MTLRLMYITNRLDIAEIAENAGVDRIFVDLEYIGKSDRQGGMDTVQNRHTVQDVSRLSAVLKKAELMVRVNPIHSATSEYCSSKEEIDAVIEAGAQIVMLPFFKTVDEVKEFVRLVDGRAKTFPLLETPEAADLIDEILEIPGIDEIHIGLNDMSLGYGMKFMFQLITDGKVESWCKKISKKGIPYGFGGIASLGKGILPAEYVIAEHYRLGSSCAILSRSFCDVNKTSSLNEIKTMFENGMKEIREYENKIKNNDLLFFDENHKKVVKIVEKVVEG